MKIVMIALLLTIPRAAAAQFPSGEWILEKVDENIGSDTKISLSEMVIHGRRGSRTIQSKSWIKGEDESFTEYLAPAREKGTKMLKLGDQLWTYSPDTDRTILISGHMLRQPVMGSDLSYEDLMEDNRLQDLYEATVSAEEIFLDRSCWVLELRATAGDVAYHSRKIWVDKERFVTMKEERFAKSGKLLKTTEVRSVTRTGDRWVPDRAIFKDVLKSGEGTEFVILSIEFNAEIPDYVLSKASLRK